MQNHDESFHGIRVKRQTARSKEEQLNVIIVGAGLGGLGAAIALLLAGHKVHVLESASQIAEVGAGIQVLPNSARVLIQWGLGPRLASLATIPEEVVMLSWRSDRITSMNFADAAEEYQAPFWDFHRADLHSALLNRAEELGMTFQTRSRVIHVDDSDTRRATVVLSDGRRMSADLVIGADGIHSKCREVLLAGPSPPTPSCDLAYRVLLDTNGMRDDPTLASFLETHQVRYWMGPGAHAVSYKLRQGELLNMVLLVPDDIPEGEMTVNASVEEMRSLFAGWDPRISKALQYCKSVQKWRLCYRPGLTRRWYNASGSFALLGDAVHATLPYLASGAGMSLEDGAVLGECFARISGTSVADKTLALSVYEDCRRHRTESIVERGNLQQWLYHLDDGEEQRARDARFKAFGDVEELLKSKDRSLEDGKLPGGLEEGSDPLAWRRNGVGKWLINYDCLLDVEAKWSKPTEEVFRLRPSL
ncbi:related to salicylate hydroxylase [Ramularia collo-cygni]|uniref:Related to salicylate hydroxylase n=1 Tax=Ramularia collo-cygni TaxID=112498 RepID=A0A2D3UYM6_9PEZI|nr:related to salicylate hydroxylase [Ramularia collo-cygni]CZT22001.1 related to salicylate hydroxylase [Ramularia collo-cygni]